MSNHSPRQIVNVLVIYGLEWLVGILIQTYIQAKPDIVCAGIGRVQVNACRVDRTFLSPILRQKGFQRIFVFGGNNRDGRFRGFPSLAEKVTEYGANHFELIGGAATLVLIRVGYHDEVGAADLDPGLAVFCQRGVRKRSNQSVGKQKTEQKAIHPGGNPLEVWPVSHGRSPWFSEGGAVSVCHKLREGKYRGLVSK